MMYDFCIIGSGPAGATLARLLSKKYRIILIDKRNLNDTTGNPVYNKCCGGLLAPDAQAMLARFDLGLPNHILVGPQLFVVRTIDLQSGRERLYQRHYINIDREMFDRWLVGMIPENVTTEYNAVVKTVIETEEKTSIIYSKKREQHTVEARYCIGADGARSRVRGSIIKMAPAIKEYIAIQKTYRTDGKQSHFSAFFDTSITDFYGWTIPKQNTLLVGVALKPGKKANKQFDSMINKLKKLGFPLTDQISTDGAWIYRPGQAKQITTGRGRIALVGEAAGFISPSSAEGLSFAFKSALILASTINRSPEKWPSLYKKKTGSLKKSLQSKIIKSRVMYTPFLRNIILSSGLQSLSVHSDLSDK